MVRLLTIIFFSFFLLQCNTSAPVTQFDGKQAFEHLLVQEAMGPRIPGTPGQQKFLQWAEELLKDYGWEVRRQDFEAYYQQKGEVLPMTNLVATRYPHIEDRPLILLGTHFDTRAFADEDPDHPDMPVPGAHDGASGVAVLIETARIISEYYNLLPEYNIALLLFDGEDGGITSRYFCMGSRWFVRNDHLVDDIEFAVILDMIGNKDLQIFKEKRSYDHSPELVRSFWREGRRHYPENFYSEVKYEIYDDHVPFIDRGIPAFLVIDFDYPYWHTIQDTADKCSPDSLQAVGDVLLVFLEKHRIIQRRNNG